MQVSVSGKQIKVGSALRDHVEEQLTKSIKKYFENAVSADVVFSKLRHLFRVDIIVNDGTGNNVIIKSNAENDDVYASFEQGLEKISKQLKRYKSKIKDHHKNINPGSDVTKYVLSSKSKDMDKDEKNDSPLIIAEKKTKIDAMTVGEAVMVMELSNLPALMFVNRKTSAVGVVYRRDDGNISWVDSGVKHKI